MSQVYDRNHNQITVGQRVMVSTNGETDEVAQINADNLGYYDAQHNACVQLKNGTQIAPAELVRLG